MKLFYFLCFVSIVYSDPEGLTEQGVSNKDIEVIMSEISHYREYVYDANVVGQPEGKRLTYLTYSEALAKEAQKVADTCTSIPQKEFAYNPAVNGESVFYMTSTRRKICNKWKDVLRSWFVNHHYFVYGSNPLPHQVPYYEMVGEFNRYVGCGYAQCRAKCNRNFTSFNNLFVCKYGRVY